MRPAKDVERLIRRAHFKASANLHNRTITDALRAQVNSKESESVSSLPGIRRTIMRSRITKLTAATFVVAVFVGVYQLGGPRAAFAHTTRVVRTTLADLREFASSLGEREPDSHIYEANLPPAEPDRSGPDIQYTIISARVKEFSVVGDQDGLLDFLDNEGVELLPAGDCQGVSYAKLDPDRAEHLIDFARAGDDLELVSSPSLMLREGHEGTVGIFGGEAQDTVALALAATVLDDDGHIDLSFSFLHGQSGFEMPSLEIGPDEDVLFHLPGTAETQGNSNGEDAHDSENAILVLIRIEATSPG